MRVECFESVMSCISCRSSPAHDGGIINNNYGLTNVEQVYDIHQ